MFGVWCWGFGTVRCLFDVVVLLIDCGWVWCSALCLWFVLIYVVIIEILLLYVFYLIIAIR